MKVVVVTPNGVDSGLALGFLASHGMETHACMGLEELGPMLSGTIGCVVLVEEALVESDVDSFHTALQSQPAWSDLPVLLIAARDSSLSALVERIFPRSGNVTVLQRPLNPVTLISAVNVALRSRQRQLEVRELLAMRDSAVQQRDEFLAMLAHELRNPLAPIRNAVYLLGTLEYTDPLFVKCRGMIEKQARHITRLVDDLLDVSRLELRKVELRVQRLDLNVALAAAAEACLPMTSMHRHSVNVRAAPLPLWVRADPVRLEQVIGNLIVNAAKFTPDGGTIDVEGSSEAGEALVTVRDNGVGIDPVMLDSIFELFRQGSVTAARTEGGLGIGLTLVRRLMELHGGSVRAHSEGLGLGSSFEVRLPLDRSAASRESGSTRASSETKPRRVLIIEDGTDARDSLGMLVRSWQHEVIYASSGPEGLSRAREQHPDVALVDIGLPGFDGYHIARQIRGEDSPWSRSVRLIALTGYGQSADREKAMAAGFDVHLLKPVDPAELRELLVSAPLSA